MLLGNVKKEADMQMQDDVIGDYWKNRGFHCIDECKLDIRRTVIKKHFQNRAKTLNGIIPTCEKMSVCDDSHSPMCPRCKLKIET